MQSQLRRKMHRLNELARQQHGVVCRSQALALGYSDSAIGRCVAAGLWERRFAGVYQVSPSPRRFETAVMALVLRAPGRAWASHRAAAWIWGLTDGGPPPAEISTTANLRGRAQRIHLVEEMPEADRGVVSAIPVTSVERTLIDMAGLVSNARLEGAVAEALRADATTLSALRDRVELGAGRAGQPRLRRLLDGWEDRSESVLETRLRRLLRRHGIPTGIPQLPVFDEGRLVARIDLAYPEQRVAVEADGYRLHGDRASWQADLARRNTLTRLGWHVLHYTWGDVEQRPDRVVSEVRAALAGRPVENSRRPGENDGRGRRAT